MTELSDPNQRIARLMGKTVVTLPFIPSEVNEFGSDVFFTPEAAREWRKTYPGGASIRTVPNYFSPDLPIGERLKMWEKLTEEQKLKIVRILTLKETAIAPDYCAREMTAAITFALSPEFPSTFLRVVEGKG